MSELKTIDVNYEEEYRSQFHFMPPEKWMNDPNGMVYYEGEYHLCYQFYPDGTTWGPMHWGHAVSKDLVHWEHLPIALYPDDTGMIFSGSIVVDWNDTSGFFSGESGLVAIFTSGDIYPNTQPERQRQRQSIAYSTDRGRTWTMYEGNPVLSDPSITDFRDPKVFWHEDTKRWIMVIEAGETVRFYTSSNLKEWKFASEFGEGEGSHHGVWECPDLFKLPVDSNQAEQKWVLLVGLGDDKDTEEGSKSQYFIGDFDGQTFINANDPETILWTDYGRDNYAGVSWSDIPEEDGRRIYIGWMSNWQYAHVVPTETWRSAMTVPRVLTLRDTEEGVRLYQEPIQELKKIRSNPVSITDLTISAGEQTLENIKGNSFELIAEFAVNDAKEFGLKVRKSDQEETIIGYNVDEERLYVDRRRSGDNSFHEGFAGIHDADLRVKDNQVKLHVFVDWSSVEVFANDGEKAITDLIFPKNDSEEISVFSKGADVTLRNLEFYELTSIWK